MNKHLKAVHIANAQNGFFQEPPSLKNQYTDDLVLQNILKRILPNAVLESVEPDLSRFGQRVIDDIMSMGEDVDEPNNYPRLKQYDAWCRRVDEITTAHGWKRLNDVSAEEGLVAIAYERRYNEFSRIYQFAKQYLFSPSAAVYTCPLSMTDGAARIIELLGTDKMKSTIYPRLISRNPLEFWTSGQWMTERPGGSDVGQTETIAELDDESNNQWSISGFKWFSSATTADLSMLLARTVDPKTNQVVAGSKGLSLFVAEMRNPEGSLNGVRVHRLKNKFGTKGLPTAELELIGMKASMLGKSGRGVPNIAAVLNITRVYACLCVVSSVRRSLVIAKDFSQKRQAFNKYLNQTPLHIATLAQLELVHRAGAQIAFYCIELLGRTECGKATAEDICLLRLVTPVAKGYVCKIGVAAISEAMEALGGQGYMEETKLGCLYRDAQVNTIWEGTTNVMSLDVLRVLRETKNAALDLFTKVLKEKVDQSAKISDHLVSSAQSVHISLKNINTFIQESHSQLEVNSRQLMFAFGKTLAGALLIEQAAFGLSNKLEGAEQDLFAAQQWCDNSEFQQKIRAVQFIDKQAKLVYGSNAKI